VNWGRAWLDNDRAQEADPNLGYQLGPGIRFPAAAWLQQKTCPTMTPPPRQERLSSRAHLPREMVANAA